MYLRTTRRRNADGSVTQYHQLAENIWDPTSRCAVAKVIYNFGRAEQVDHEALRRLAGSILRVFAGEDALAADPDVRVLDAWPYGGLYVLEALWRELTIPEALTEACRARPTRQPVERALFAMVANRALHPYSKLSCHEQWLDGEVFFPGHEALELQHLYRAMDLLEAHKDAIETRRLLPHGRPAERRRRPDLLRHDVAALRDRRGRRARSTPDAARAPAQARVCRRTAAATPRRSSSAWPSRATGCRCARGSSPARPTTSRRSRQVKADLRGWRLNRCVFVGDAGMNSEDNRRTLALGGGKYILATQTARGRRGRAGGADPPRPLPGRGRQPARQGGGRRRRRAAPPLRGLPQPARSRASTAASRRRARGPAAGAGRPARAAARGPPRQAHLRAAHQRRYRRYLRQTAAACRGSTAPRSRPRPSSMASGSSRPTTTRSRPRTWRSATSS